MVLVLFLINASLGPTCYFNAGCGMERNAHYVYHGVWVTVPLLRKTAIAIPIGFNQIKSRDRFLSVTGLITRVETGFGYYGKHFAFQPTIGLDFNNEVRALIAGNIQFGHGRIWNEIIAVTHFFENLWARERLRVMISKGKRSSWSTGLEYIYSGWNDQMLGWVSTARLGIFGSVDIGDPKKVSLLLGGGKGTASVGWYFSTELGVKLF